jgi:toxin-antitoxin system PIN domain toxin
VNVPDVNVLVALHRPQHQHHTTAQHWWHEGRRHGEPVTVPDLVWVGFIRVVTNRRIFSSPSTTEGVWAFVEAMRAQGIYIQYAAHPRLLDMLGVQLRNARASADLVTDAYIAASAIALGATVVTFDGDFRRFDGLSVRELA